MEKTRKCHTCGFELDLRMHLPDPSERPIESFPHTDVVGEGESDLNISLLHHFARGSPVSSCDPVGSDDAWGNAELDRKSFLNI